MKKFVKLPYNQIVMKNIKNMVWRLLKRKNTRISRLYKIKKFKINQMKKMKIPLQKIYKRNKNKRKKKRKIKRKYIIFYKLIDLKFFRK